MKDFAALLKHSAYQWFIAVDQLLNCVFSPLSWNTWADETFSSRCGRLGVDVPGINLKARQPYKTYRIVVDLLFRWQGPNHCRNAYLKELDRIQLPPEMRK